MYSTGTEASPWESDFEKWEQSKDVEFAADYAAWQQSKDADINADISAARDEVFAAVTGLDDEDMADVIAAIQVEE